MLVLILNSCPLTQPVTKTKPSALSDGTSEICYVLCADFHVFYFNLTLLTHDVNLPLFPFQTVMIPGPELKPGQEFDALNYKVPKPEAVQWNK